MELVRNKVNPKLSTIYEDGFVTGVVSHYKFWIKIAALAEIARDRFQNLTDEQKQNPMEVLVPIFELLAGLLAKQGIECNYVSAHPIGWVMEVPTSGKSVLIYAQRAKNKHTGFIEYIPAYQVITARTTPDAKPKLYRIKITAQGEVANEASS